MTAPRGKLPGDLIDLIGGPGDFAPVPDVQVDDDVGEAPDFTIYTTNDGLDDPGTNELHDETADLDDIDAALEGDQEN